MEGNLRKGEGGKLMLYMREGRGELARGGRREFGGHKKFERKPRSLFSHERSDPFLHPTEKQGV